MFFADWKEKDIEIKIPKHLLWDYDLSNMDWNFMRVAVVQRVIERGFINDFYSAIKLYGGIENFKKIIKEVPELSSKNMNFVCSIFDLKKEELKCYTRKQLREKHLSS